MSDRHPPVDRMAEIILRRPTVTAQQLARELGFAEERSVYYWLRKAGYNGLKAFRSAVLTGDYPVAVPRDTGRPGARQVAEVPLLSTAWPDEPTLAGYVVTTRIVSRAAFAVSVDSDDYRPLVERDDILLIDPSGNLADGDLALVQPGSGPPVLCRVYTVSRPWFVHPVTGRPVLHHEAGAKDGPTLLGRVVELHRAF
ncbi:MAG: hypothetical protein H0Z37_06895 [Firmicutes bacterium]|nr:hypothetical protein [Bacillota bacterium]